MRGQVARYLESQPDHPGLLLLRGISELFCSDYEIRDVIQNIKAGLDQADSYILYRQSQAEIKSLICHALLEAGLRFPERSDEVTALLLDGIDDVEFGRELLATHDASPPMVYRAAQFLLNKNSSKALELV
jgi:hypothetical protein